MYLRSLELQGFKSFPDKIKLEFNKGISAVVGPNGSGKSNIGDAMRWVMGEQSSKTLRGGKMEDVIFHGTKNRPSAGFAQVTLNIDNTDHALSVDTDVVSVSRKLYRNGDSEYMINSTNVRLKDIVELFMDTGLGRDGYSIIGQGKIADIVSSKSTERREIFEEAAGISKFRYKKEEAERKLKAAEDNIARLNDIISEIESRIGPLEKQCEKAKKFKVLYDQKSKLEISVWVAQLKQLENALTENKDRLSLIKEQYEQISAEANRISDEAELTSEKSSEKSVLIDELREKIHAIEMENSQADAKIAVLNNDIQHIESAIENVRVQIEQSESSKYFLETELEQKREELKDFDVKKTELEAKIKEHEEKFSDLRDLSEDQDKAVAESNSALSALYIKKSELSYKLETAKNSLSEVQEALEGNIEDQKDFDNKNKLASSELLNLRSKREKLSEQETEFNNRISGLTKLLENKKTKLAAAESIYDDNNDKLRETEQRLKVLRDLENSLDGFGFSVKNILTASKQGRLPGVCGTVSQLISVPSEYTVAIEIALGPVLQHIIVENEDTAKRGIRILKESKAGRATFLPISSVKGRAYNNPPKNEDGYIAMANELVSCDEKYSGIMMQILGKVCVAEDINSAAAIAKKLNYSLKIVTLDGQIVNAGGSFTGGSIVKNNGILSRKNEIDKLSDSFRSLSEKNETLKADKERLVQETAKYSADIEGSKEQLSELSKELIKLDMDIKRVEEFSLQYSERLDDIVKETERLTMRLALLKNEINDFGELLAETDKKIFEDEADLEKSQNKIESLRADREKLSEELSELRVKQIELAKDREACEQSVARLEESISGSSDDKQKLLYKIEEHKAEIEEKKNDIENVRVNVTESSKTVQLLKNDIESARREHLELDNKATLLRQDEKVKLDEKEKLSNELNRLEERIKSGEVDFDKLAAKLWDDHELTLSEAEKDCEPVENMPQANKELAELRAKINALGNVNLGAIEEYAEVSERYEFLKHQMSDVTKSKNELETLISELTETMKDMFVESFEKINKNFKQIFTELFGGGHGELELTDPNNVLECGIEIKVEPPGKIIKNLLSLSGGEQAFVAVCIYFSILKIRPSPFCLLDEIEAALDDSNVVRYAQYLHRFTDTTQFIAITHRRGTMEEADVLYGVTMQEEGISKLLKMDPGETVNMKLDQ